MARGIVVCPLFSGHFLVVCPLFTPLFTPSSRQTAVACSYILMVVSLARLVVSGRRGAPRHCVNFWNPSCLAAVVEALP